VDSPETAWTMWRSEHFSNLLELEFRPLGSPVAILSTIPRLIRTTLTSRNKELQNVICNLCDDNDFILYFCLFRMPYINMPGTMAPQSKA
jgi:hypothetical protein